MKADALLDAGDLDGQRVWLRIIKAIEKLQRTTKPDGARPLSRCSHRANSIHPLWPCHF
jgi:hypothetical protein